MARGVEIFGALGGLLYAGLVLLEESGRGFPDGHLTTLERALRAPRIGAAVLAIGLGLWLLRRGPSTRWALLVVLVGIAIVERIGLPLVGGWLGLEDGAGG